MTLEATWHELCVSPSPTRRSVTRRVNRDPEDESIWFDIWYTNGTAWDSVDCDWCMTRWLWFSGSSMEGKNYQESTVLPWAAFWNPGSPDSSFKISIKDCNNNNNNNPVCCWDVPGKIVVSVFVPHSFTRCTCDQVQSFCSTMFLDDMAWASATGQHHVGSSLCHLTLAQWTWRCTHWEVPEGWTWVRIMRNYGLLYI